MARRAQGVGDTPVAGVSHGYAAYQDSYCRCVVCRDAKASYDRDHHRETRLATPRRKEERMTDQNKIGTEQLWAVHVAGPDDLLPMFGRAAADELAAKINAIAAQIASRPDAHPLDPILRASVVAWDGSAEQHANLAAAFQAGGGDYWP